MSLLEIGDAALRYSDNTAANLLLAELGGPEGLDEALEAIGDDVIHVDRIEPGLSEAVPGDVRDTSTPRAMATSLGEFTLRDALPEEKREIITQMMLGNTTGDELIRAGVPDDWKVGDKTGSGGYGTRNDIAVLWPPQGVPIVLAVMSSRDVEGAEFDNALIAEAAEVVVEAWAKRRWARGRSAATVATIEGSPNTTNTATANRHSSRAFRSTSSLCLFRISESRSPRRLCLVSLQRVERIRLGSTASPKTFNGWMHRF
jgi:hypothetical protein